MSNLQESRRILAKAVDRWENEGGAVGEAGGQTQGPDTRAATLEFPDSPRSSAPAQPPAAKHWFDAKEDRS